MSVEKAVERMEQWNIPSNHGRIHFAQILGMADYISFGLGKSGFNAYKLVLYGKFDNIFPWLLRRIDETKV